MSTAEEVPEALPLEVDFPQSVPGRLGPYGKNRMTAWFGPPWQRRLSWGALQVGRIRSWEAHYDTVDDVEIRHASLRLRGRARGGTSLDRLLPEAFGLCCVACKRTVQMRPFDVQLAGSVILNKGGLAELITGEGKTLTAIMPAYLNALPGKGVHVTTVNDYLARRDAEFVGPVFQTLGLSVGVLQMKMEDDKRAAAYRCDLTYGMASEFGFDFLRDRLKVRGGQVSAGSFLAPWTSDFSGAVSDSRVQRSLNFALVDEADSIFIDEARTPLIISAPTRQATPEEQVVYLWADGLGQKMQRDEHYTVDLKKNKCELTDAGKQLVRWSNPPSGPHSHAIDKLHEHIERALQANHRMYRDHHYMVINEKVVIVDEFTGRPMPDRHWREGLHQAVEAKERVPITLAADHAAQITFQNYFRHYRKLAGMSGTARPNFWEMRRVYKLWVTHVPTNRPLVRTRLPDRVFPTEDLKFAAIVQEIKALQAAGRPVLVGTRSVEKSEELAKRLTAEGVPHLVLNAKQNEQEAQIVSQAGQMGRVTIATNMAGRGTDIKLGEGVAALGGLHVIGTERHEALRIDRQLLGRAGRQGDPGSGQFFVSLEDELLEVMGVDWHEGLKEFARRHADRPESSWQMYRPMFVKAQRKTERKHYRQRLDLMHYDRNRLETLADLGADPFVD